jgi:NADP-dependent 3-hydroxy acid dehydrogenase YdfG
LAFARAGAAKIVLIGRNEEKLQSTQKQLDCPSFIHAANVTDETAITQVATSIGTWDIMILAAGHISPRAHMREASVNEWWQNFEVCFLELALLITRLYTVLITIMVG